MTTVNINGLSREMTAEEQVAFDTEQNSLRIPGKLKEIRNIRNVLLKETDIWVLKGDITDAQKTKRQEWRDVPQTYATEEEYDLLVATDNNGQLTNEIWSKL